MAAQGTASFDADIAIAESGGDAVRARLTVTDDAITITAAGAEIGSWRRSEVEVVRVGGAFLFGVEGEQLVVDVTDADRLAAALSGHRPTDEFTGGGRHLRDGVSHGRLPTGWKVWAPAGGLVLVAAVALAGGPGSSSEVGETATTTSPTETSPTSRPVSTTTVIDGDLLARPAPGSSGDPGAAPPEAAEPVEVVAIVDGDTLDVRRSDGRLDTLRLIGINAPEAGECLSDPAAGALTALAPPGSTVHLTFDTSDRDAFGRLLRYVWVGSLSVNEELVRRGLAIARRYPPDTARADVLEAAQASAREGGAGLWAPDACGPVADAALGIVDVNYDPPGNDNDFLNEEWVRVRNLGDGPVDLTGWTVRDESASHRYQFPDGFTLAPDEVVTLHTGCGTDFSTDLHWCNPGSAIWNNDGDTVFLLDPSGNVHTSYGYSPAVSVTTASTSPATTTATTTATTIATTVATTTTRPAATTTTVAADCHPSYPDVCIPPPPPDLDCAEISDRNFTVVGSDPHGFDRDNDGIGCES